MELCIARCAAGFVSTCSKNCPFSLQLCFFDLSSIDQSQLCRQCGHDIIMHVYVIASTQTNMVLFKIPYSEKLLREKTFVNFVVFAKVFSTKFGGVIPFGMAKASNSRKFSPRKLYFSPIHDSFPLQMFPAII